MVKNNIFSQLKLCYLGVIREMIDIKKKLKLLEANVENNINLALNAVNKIETLEKNINLTINIVNRKMEILEKNLNKKIDNLISRIDTLEKNFNKK